jgi:hypothetical protein
MRPPDTAVTGRQIEIALTRTLFPTTEAVETMFGASPRLLKTEGFHYVFQRKFLIRGTPFCKEF